MKTGAQQIFERAFTLLKGNVDHPSQVELKGIGLHLILLGLAEVQSERLSHVALLAKQLEEKVFDPEHINSLEPARAVAYYKLALRSLEEMYKYVGSVVRGFDWVEVQSRLLTIAASKLKEDTQLSQTAKEIVKQLSTWVDMDMLESEKFNQGEVVDVFSDKPVLKKRNNSKK